MYRTDNTTSVPTQPATPAVGVAGYFTEGDPAASVPATILDAWWLNQVQEEILSVVTLAGLTPSKTSQRQLYDAIQAIANVDLSGYLRLTGGALAGPGNLSVGGTLTVTGNTTVQGAFTVNNPQIALNGLTEGQNIVATATGGASGAVSSTYQGHGIGFWSLASQMQFGTTDAYGNAITPAWMTLDGTALNLQSPTAYKPGGGTWTAPASSRAVKRDIAPYDRGLDAIRQLEPVTFCFNGMGGTPDDGRVYHGLIADDVLRVMPEMVSRQPGALLGLDYDPLSFALINAVKELADRVEALEQP